MLIEASGASLEGTSLDILPDRDNVISNKVFVRTLPEVRKSSAKESCLECSTVICCGGAEEGQPRKGDCWAVFK